MGLNAFFTFTVCFGLGFTWQEALAMVFLCGIFNILITVTKIRKLLIVSIPESLQHAISAGIGVFIAYIGVALSRGWGFASILLLPVLLPNLVLIALGLGSLGGLTADTAQAMDLAYYMPSLGGEKGGDAYAWTWFGSWSILLFVAMIIAIVAAAVRVGVRRARTGRAEWARVWQLPLVSLVLGAIVFYGLLPLHFSGTDAPLRSSDGEAARQLSYGIQPNALTFFMFGIVVAIISVLAELFPMWIYSTFPALLQLAGGKKASAAWRAGRLFPGWHAMP